MIGRKDRLEELVKAILEEDRPLVVPGALGMGKTTLALAAAYEPSVIARFGKERRFFVNLEPAPNADGILSRLAADLGVSATGATSEVESKIAAACAAQQTLAILDNLETPWREDSPATEALLGRLAAIEGLRLIVTVRGQPPRLPGPGTRALKDVEQLEDNDARTLFLRHAGDHFGSDAALPGLLKALDGHPLSIELLAANAQGKPDLKGLAADWSDRRADLLRHGAAYDRKTSLRASLDLSLAALGAASAAHRLLRLMALLPDGMSEADSRTILSDDEPTKEERDAAARLETARLASRASGRWRLLAPVRETLVADFLPEAEDRARLVDVFLRRAALGRGAGTEKWNDVREELTAEAGNLDAMIGVAATERELSEKLSSAVIGLRELHRFTGLASCAFVPAVAKRFHDAGDLLSEANCIKSLGDLAFSRYDSDGASRHYEAALPLYQKAAHVLGEANCVRNLGDVALRRSDLDDARQRYEAALPLYEKIGAALGEANCVKSLGNIALRHLDHEGAHRRFETALPLYQKAGDVLGEANCIRSLGDIALRRSDYAGARERYEAALPLYQKVGAVLGEANCILSLGNTALRGSDHAGARQLYEAARPLFQKVGSVLGEANCMQRLGDIDEAESEIVLACEHWREALALYSKIPDPYSMALTRARLARRAATPVEAAEHRQAARSAWESIDRQDLIEEYLGKNA
jgi:tetratricopeptide (TPR) repeat protein